MIHNNLTHYVGAMLECVHIQKHKGSGTEVAADTATHMTITVPHRILARLCTAPLLHGGHFTHSFGLIPLTRQQFNAREA